MSDARETLRRGLGDFAPRPDGFERVLERRDRKRRNQRIMAGALAAAIVIIGALAFVRVLRSAPAPTGEGGVPKNGGVVFSALFVIDGIPGSVTRADPRDIYLTLPGRDPQRILGSDLDGLDQRCPTFSPDGTKLAYVEGRRDGSSPSIVAVVDVDEDGVLSDSHGQVVGDAYRSLGGCAQWSPDGRKLAVVEQEFGLRIATLDGRSHVVRFGTFRPGFYSGGRTFAWSPDGSTIAIVDAGTVWLVPVDGGEPRTLWVAVGRQIPGPIAWAPDGSWLAIGGSVGRADGCCDGHRPFIEIVDAADGSISALPTTGAASGDTIEDLTWLPREGRILVTYFHGGHVLADPTGAAPTTVLALESRHTLTLELSPDGRWVLHVADDGVSSAIMAEPLDGSVAPVFYSPWSYGLFTEDGDFSWRPIYP